MKSDSRLARNFLMGTNGDAVNALLCACAYNLLKILNKLRLFCAQMGIGLSDLLAMLRLQQAYV